MICCAIFPAKLAVTAQQFHFGEFRLDQSGYRLERGERRLRLEKQPMELLILLVQRRGELVSREEIAAQLWGKEVFVDVDHSINTAVRKVRMALRDDPEHPRFVETVVGKGYRFSAPVTCSNSAPQAVADGQQPSAERQNNPEVTDVKAVLRDRIAAQEDPASAVQVRQGRTWLFLMAGSLVVLAVAWVWSRSADYFWRNPILDARLERVTDFEASSRAAAVSRDGHLIAFVSDRDGSEDVWITQAGSGQFHNLTKGGAGELVNPAVRSLGFTPDGSSVLFWARRPGSNGTNISIWAVPALGGEPRPYLEGAAELNWSHDQSRVAYHTAGPGDPLFVSRGLPAGASRQPIFQGPPGIHSHFPIWSPRDDYIYFVHGALPDKLDIWRIRPAGGPPERLTFQNGTISYPAFLDKRTLVYLATDADGSGPWLYGIDVEHRNSRRLSGGLERYTSLAATEDGMRLVLTLSTPKKSLWRTQISASGEITTPVPVALTTSTGFSPRLGPDYLLYFSQAGTSESIWKLSAGTSTELWKGDGAQLLGGPAISRDGRRIAFSARQNGKTRLYAMRADGSEARIVTEALDLQGSPSWTIDGLTVVTAASQNGKAHLFRVPIDGGPVSTITTTYATDPAVSPDDGALMFSGPDVGTSFALKRIKPNGTADPMPPITLTRGSRHFAFIGAGRSILVLRGEIQHKDLWTIDLTSGAERQLTSFAPGFDVSDFDVSSDGRDIILERMQEHSDIVMLDRKR